MNKKLEPYEIRKCFKCFDEKWIDRYALAEYMNFTLEALGYEDRFIYHDEGKGTVEHTLCEVEEC